MNFHNQQNLKNNLSFKIFMKSHRNKIKNYIIFFSKQDSILEFYLLNKMFYHVYHVYDVYHVYTLKEIDFFLNPLRTLQLFYLIKIF